MSLAKVEKQRVSLPFFYTNPVYSNADMSLKVEIPLLHFGLVGLSKANLIYDKYYKIGYFSIYYN